MGTSSADSTIRARHGIGSDGSTRGRAHSFHALVACSAICVLSSQASAHLGHGIASSERRIELELHERHVTIGYSIGLATGSAKTDLEAAKARNDENSKLDAVTAELVRAVEICAGETEASLSCRPLEKRELESVSANGWGTDTLTIEWRFRAPLRERTLRLDDRWTREDIARTDVVIRPQPTRAPLRAGPDTPKSVELEFAFDDRLLAGAPRVVFVELPPEPSRKRTTLIAVVVLVGVAVLVAALFARRRRTT